MVQKESGLPLPHRARLLRLTVPGDGVPIEEDDVVQAESPRISPVRGRAGPVTRDVQTSMSSRKATKKDSDSDDEKHALQDLKLWESYTEVLEEALPQELLGWLLLRRAGLSNSARLNVQAAEAHPTNVTHLAVVFYRMEHPLVALF